jgi:hypothetical protein
MDIVFREDWQEFPSILSYEEISNPISTIIEYANEDCIINVRENMNELFQSAILSERFQKLPAPFQEKIVDTYNEVLKITESGYVLKKYSKQGALSYCIGSITSNTL